MSGQEENQHELFMDINIPQTLFEFNFEELDRILEQRIYDDLEEVEGQDLYENLVGIGKRDDQSITEDSQDNSDSDSNSSQDEPDESPVDEEEI